MSAYILVLYYSHKGSTKALAQAIARGIEQQGKFEAKLRTVPSVRIAGDSLGAEQPEPRGIFCTKDELLKCSGLILGSPTRFGQMAAALKYFLDGTTSEWVNGALIGKPAGVFSSTSSLHGGQESTLLSMMLPLLHHGMVIAGIPFSESGISTTESGGTPYGPSHLARGADDIALSDEEYQLCISFGKRLASLAEKLEASA